jgi:hypothetical protein
LRHFPFSQPSGSLDSNLLIQSSNATDALAIPTLWKDAYYLIATFEPITLIFRDGFIVKVFLLLVHAGCWLFSFGGVLAPKRNI